MSALLAVLSLSKTVCVILSLIPSTINIVEGIRFGRSEGRIVDGVNVTPVNKYPMAVALEGPNGLRCGGSILNKYFILTAADCAKAVQSDQQNFRVVAGTYSFGDPDPRYVQNISIVKVTYHIRYRDASKGRFANSVGVVKVRTPLVWNEYVAPTNLPTPGWTVVASAETVHGMAVGWGPGRNRTYPFSPTRPLQEIELPLLTTEACQRAASSYTTDDQICAETVGGAAPCVQDDGGPLFIYNEADDKHIQIGIMSIHQNDCGNATDTFNPVWTKVSKFLHWIEEAIRECNPPRTF